MASLITFLLNIPLFPENTTWLGTPLFSTLLIVIGWFAYSEFKKNREMQRSIAAAKAYNEIKSCVDDITTISSKPNLYEYKGYYPDSMPETYSENATASPERPARLMQNRIYLCRKRLGELLAQIGDNYAKKLLDNLSSMEKQVSLLGNSLFAQNRGNQDIADATKRYLDECPKKILLLEEEILQILVPMIEMHGYLYKLSSGIKSWFCKK